MFNENKYSFVFHPGLSLGLYFKGKPDFFMISWKDLEIIFDKIWCKKKENTLCHNRKVHWSTKVLMRLFLLFDFYW